MASYIVSIVTTGSLSNVGINFFKVYGTQVDKNIVGCKVIDYTDDLQK